jgi:hypothetical protein
MSDDKSPCSNNRFCLIGKINKTVIVARVVPESKYFRDYSREVYNAFYHEKVIERSEQMIILEYCMNPPDLKRTLIYHKENKQFNDDDIKSASKMLITEDSIFIEICNHSPKDAYIKCIKERTGEDVFVPKILTCPIYKTIEI